MEQKKILWVILTITAFVVVVFGIALLLYSPSRNNEQPVNRLTDDTSSIPNQASIDPDAWVRDSDSIPNPENGNTPVNINNNVTIVTGGDESVGLDISGLDDSSPKTDGSLPDELAAEIIPTENKEKETEKKAENDKAEKSKEAKAPVADSGVKKIVAKKTVKKPVARKNVPKAKVVSGEKSVPRDIFWVQTASLTSRIYAEDARKVLQDQNMKAEIFTKQTIAGLVHRVRVGPFSNKTEAEYWLKNIKKIEGFEDSFVSKEHIN